MVWNYGQLVQQCIYLLMHPAIRAGEHFGQIDGFKQSGPLSKHSRILFGKNVCAVNTWGHNWARRKILFHCDNSTVVSIQKKGSTRCKEIMTLVRILCFCAAHYNTHVMITHITGTNNCIADAISCFQMDPFRSLVPQANPNPDPILALQTSSSASYKIAAST